MKTDYEPFDVAADYLVSEARIAGYLSAAAEDEDPNVLLLALCDAAKARGMMEVAKAAGLNRESLYKALKPGAHPRFETVQAVLRALGVKLSMSARAGEARAAPDDVADEARLTQLVEEVVEDKSSTAPPEKIAARRAVTIDDFRRKAADPADKAVPDVTAKIMNRSYQRSGVVAGGTLLSSAARQVAVNSAPSAKTGKQNKEGRTAGAENSAPPAKPPGESATARSPRR